MGATVYLTVTLVASSLGREDSPHHTAITAADLLLITTIVWFGGGAHSEYYLLYYLPVAYAGIRLQARDGIAASVLAGVLYTFVALTEHPNTTIITTTTFRVLAVCISTVILVVFFALLKQQIALSQSLRSALHNSLQTMAAVYDVAHVANTGADLSAIVPVFLEHAVQAVRADSGVVALFQANGNLDPIAVYSPPCSKTTITLDCNCNLAKRAIENNAPVVGTIGEADEASPSGTTIVFIPLRTPAGAIGVLALAAYASRRFKRPQLEFLQTLCTEAAIAIENVHLRTEMHRMAITDPLTKIPNRRAITERLAAELARVQRYGSTLSILMVDVDNLKSVNDRYGHAEGDEVLTALGRMLSSNIRGSDAAGRMGGDEFIVVLSETDIEGAAVLANRLAQRFDRQIKGMRAERWLAPFPTLSIGVASLDASTIEAEPLISRADAALYQAKRAGKNRVYIASSEGEPIPADTTRSGLVLS